MTRQEQLIHRVIRLEALLQAEMEDAFGDEADAFNLHDIFTDFVQDLRAIYNIPQAVVDEIAMDETR